MVTVRGGEERGEGRSRHKNNSKRGLRNIEDRNVETIRGECPKQGLTSAEDLTIELPE